MDSLSLWLIAHYGKEQFNPGIERISFALGPLRQALANTRIITVAGTNGKGETTLRLSKLLSGHRHCTWTSPHIERISERFRSEDGEISLNELESLVKECHEKAREQDYKLTYYEFLFFVFCTWAAKRSPEYLLLEVGLGGRLDAVNFFDADIVLLPSISRDHQEYLGNRYDLILQEKLGVMRPGALLISALDSRYLFERAELTVGKMGGKIIDLGSHAKMPRKNFSQRNQFLAYAAYLELRESSDSYENWRPEENFLEHRGEVVNRGAEWTFFGSHNVDGIRKLIQFLQSGIYNLPRMSFDAVIMAFSERRKDDLLVMMRMMKASGLQNIKITCFNHPKAASRDMMEVLAAQEGLEFVKDVDSYVQGTNSGRLLVTGSYYFLGHVKSLLRR